MPPRCRSILSCTLFTLAACGGRGAGPSPTQVTAAQAAITAPRILGHIEALADDSMLGRAPGGVGEARAIKYISGEFKAIGLAPDNPDGTWFQNVELLGFTSQPMAEFHVGGKTIRLDFPKDYVAASRREAAEIDVDNSGIVFVGYGVVAPEYNWDDYKGVDVKGNAMDNPAGGAAEDLGLLFVVGNRVANDATWPTWKTGTEFKAIRETMLAGH